MYLKDRGKKKKKILKHINAKKTDTVVPLDTIASVYKILILQSDMRRFFRFILQKITEHMKDTKQNSKFPHVENNKIHTTNTP